MKKVILHIGVHKTGTSALQVFLQRNAKKLGKQGFFYKPTMREWPNHNPLADAFRVDRDAGLANRLLRNLMDEAGERTLLISSEMLSESQTDIRRLLDILDGWQKTAIAYIRHPCDILIAAFGECVRHYPLQYTRGINEFPLAYDPGQFTVLQRWMRFDDVTLVLAPYDKAQWPDGSLFADFLEMIGAAPDALDMTDVRINPSLSYTAVERLRRYLAQGASAEAHRKGIEDAMRSDVGDRSYPLTDEIIAYSFAQMRGAIEAYRPFLRSGFKENYLFEPRTST